METSMIIGGVIGLGFFIFIIASLWKVFTKAGQPGWACIIPVYNYYIMTKIAEKPGWWTILMLIPYVNIVFVVWIWNRIVKRFGKSTGFTVGVVLLGFVFIPMLAFGDAEYKADGGTGEGSDDLLDDTVSAEENLASVEA
ncbi:MAG: hypothetical protein JKY42_04500 [Flavobacteriales bacterium]|nr:hypothetical protein [Flavobacteriales bacterium]